MKKFKILGIFRYKKEDIKNEVYKYIINIKVGMQNDGIENRVFK